MTKHEITTGIILAGGKSSRMGTDKSMLEVGEISSISRVLSAIEPICDRVIIIGRPGKFMLGHESFPDLIPDLGPLGGLLTGLTHSRTQINIVAPCDMPFLNKTVFEILLQQFEQWLTAIIPVSGNKLYPLTGIYNKIILPVLYDAVKNRNLKMTDLLSSVPVKYVESNPVMPDLPLPWDFNMNTPDEHQSAIHLFKNENNASSFRKTN